MTLRTCDSSVRAIAAICGAGMPVEDANKIIARSRLDWYLALREIDFSRAPSSGESARTNIRGTHRHLHARDASQIRRARRVSGQTFMADALDVFGAEVHQARSTILQPDARYVSVILVVPHCPSRPEGKSQ
jgi:hypothetical protein